MVKILRDSKSLVDKYESLSNIVECHFLSDSLRDEARDIYQS